jgi:hypothetical protein
MPEEDNSGDIASGSAADGSFSCQRLPPRYLIGRSLHKTGVLLFLSAVSLESNFQPQRSRHVVVMPPSSADKTTQTTADKAGKILLMIMLVCECNLKMQFSGSLRSSTKLSVRIIVPSVEPSTSMLSYPASSLRQPFFNVPTLISSKLASLTHICAWPEPHAR